MANSKVRKSRSGKTDNSADKRFQELAKLQSYIESLQTVINDQAYQMHTLRSQLAKQERLAKYSSALKHTTRNEKDFIELTRQRDSFRNALIAKEMQRHRAERRIVELLASGHYTIGASRNLNDSELRLVAMRLANSANREVASLRESASTVHNELEINTLDSAAIESSTVRLLNGEERSQTQSALKREFVFLFTYPYGGEQLFAGVLAAIPKYGKVTKASIKLLTSLASLRQKMIGDAGSSPSTSGSSAVDPAVGFAETFYSAMTSNKYHNGSGAVLWHISCLPKDMDSLPSTIQFITDAFPAARIIFGVRDSSIVSRCGRWLNKDREQARIELNGITKTFEQIAIAYPEKAAVFDADDLRLGNHSIYEQLALFLQLELPENLKQVSSALPLPHPTGSRVSKAVQI